MFVKTGGYSLLSYFCKISIKITFIIFHKHSNTYRNNNRKPINIHFMKPTITLLLNLSMFAILVSSCGPRNVKDLKDVEILPIKNQEETRYQGIHDKSTNLYGIATLDGDIILQPKYTGFITQFSTDKPEKDVIIVQNPEGKIGAYSSSGKKLIDEKYESVEYQKYTSKTDSLEGFLIVKKQQRNYEYEVGPEDKSKKIVDDEYDFLYGFTTLEGKELVPCKFKRFDYCGKGYFKVETPSDKNFNTYYGLYRNGDDIIPCKYHSMSVSGYANGAVATISNEKGIEKLDERFLFDLENKCKKTKFHEKAYATDNYVKSKERFDGVYSCAIYDFSGYAIINYGKYSDIDEVDGIFLCTPLGKRQTLIVDAAVTGRDIFNEEGIIIKYTDGIFVGENVRNGRKGVIDKNGKWYVPCRYLGIKVKDGKIEAYPGGPNVEEYAIPD